MARVGIVFFVCGLEVFHQQEDFMSKNSVSLFDSLVLLRLNEIWEIFFGFCIGQGVCSVEAKKDTVRKLVFDDMK